MNDQDRIAALEARLAALESPAPGRVPMIGGTFTPPADLLPAVMALDVEAFARLKALTAGRAVTPADLVAAADWFEQTRRIAA